MQKSIQRQWQYELDLNQKRRKKEIEKHIQEAAEPGDSQCQECQKLQNNPTRKACAIHDHREDARTILYTEKVLFFFPPEEVEKDENPNTNTHRLSTKSILPDFRKPWDGYLATYGMQSRTSTDWK